MEDFPGNSHTARIQKDNTVKAEGSEKIVEPTPIDKKLVKGKVKEKPKTLGGKMKDLFIADGVDITEHLYEKVVKPKVQETAIAILDQVFDAFKDGFREVITGGRRPSGGYSSSSSRPPRTQYNRIRPSVVIRGERDRFSDRPPMPIRRSNRVRELMIENQADGEAVIETLEAMIDSDIRHCTVGDYYELMGEDVVSTDHEWGWTDLRNARVRYIADGEYLMVMPQPRPIRH